MLSVDAERGALLATEGYKGGALVSATLVDLTQFGGQYDDSLFAF